MTCRAAVNEIAKIMYSVHDKAKDKDFELELSWVCEESKGVHTRVPKDIAAAAIKYAESATKETEDEDDMEDVAE